MLLRLDVVEEIGRFAKLKHQAEKFSQLSLIFARNALGKSTICAILRSAAEGEPNHIAARRRLDATKESRVQTRWHPDQTIAFGGGKWNSCPGKIYVFDQDFIARNLHIGESVTRENKRSLLPVLLGEKAVSLSNKVLDLDREQRELSATMRREAAVITAKCPVITQKDLHNFCSKEVPSDVDERVVAAEKARELAKQSLAVTQKPSPRTIDLHSFEEFREICVRTVGSLADDVGKRVREHIQKHDLGSEGDRWLEFGAQHLTGASCPFCDQDVTGVELVAAYNAYFSEAFKKLITDRDDAIAEVKKFAEGDGLKRLADANGADFAFWNQVCSLPQLPQITDEQISIIQDGVVALATVLDAKLANPLGAFEFGSDETAISAAFRLIRQYNDAVAGCTEVIEGARAEAKGADLPKAELRYQQWVAFASKQSDPVKTAAATYAEAEERRGVVEKEKDAAQTELRTYAKTVMVTRQKDINDLLTLFGANFQIVDAAPNFKGREPNADYAIGIGNSRLAAGEKSDTEPSFKTVLSSGDKSTLALAFFLTQVRADPDHSKAVVVFDDPFSSQDMDRQFETSSQIRATAGEVCQTLVFSHDPRFLNVLERDSTVETRTFQLVCSEAGEGSISPWSVSDELKTLYVHQAEMIREFASQGKPLKNSSVNETLQAIRPFLEDYIRARFPGRFAHDARLVPMIEEIKASGPQDPLSDSVADLEALNEYSRVNMHGGGQAPNPGELRAQCKKVVEIVGRY